MGRKLDSIAARADRLRRTALRPSRPAERALFALGLSVLCPGWGHVYAGERARGFLALAIAALVVVPAWIVAGSQREGVAAGALAISGAGLVWGALPLDAAQTAFRRRPPNGVAAAGIAALFLLAGISVLRAELTWVRASVVELFATTPSTSMVPALVPGDVILADVRAAGRRRPAQGEIVIFRPPVAAESFYAKRVVATAGHTVALRGGRLLVDGRERALAAPGVGSGHHFEELGSQRYAVEVARGPNPPDFGPVTVPEGHVFVLGDNRAWSVDSRAFGPVPVDAIRGRALRVLWSRDEPRDRLRWERVGRRLGSLVSDW